MDDPTENGTGDWLKRIGRCCNAKLQTESNANKSKNRNNGNNKNNSSNESKDNKSNNNERSKNRREKKCRTIVVKEIQFVDFV